MRRLKHSMRLITFSDEQPIVLAIANIRGAPTQGRRAVLLLKCRPPLAEPAMSSAVRPSPHLPLPDSGRFPNGDLEIDRPSKFEKSARRDAGLKPFRMRLAYIKSCPL